MSLRIISPSEIPRDCSEPVDPVALEQATVIVNDIKAGGEKEAKKWAVKLGDLKEGEELWVSKEQLKEAYDNLEDSVKEVLQRTKDRIYSFAKSQRDSLTDMTTAIPGGKAGHVVAPVKAAGCYAPGGRYPLPSSVLMTACTARAAGVPQVWVASPRPAPITLGAAYVSGCDGFLKIGGAQAITCLAEGIICPASDVIVGPGNKWVTAAKSLVQGLYSIIL